MLSNFGKNTTGDVVYFLFYQIHLMIVCLFFENAKFDHMMIKLVSVGISLL